MPLPAYSQGINRVGIFMKTNKLTRRLNLILTIHLLEKGLIIKKKTYKMKM